jgi:hypothetical protein
MLDFVQPATDHPGTGFQSSQYGKSVLAAVVHHNAAGPAIILD